MHLLLILSFFLSQKQNSSCCETLDSYLGSQNVFIGKVIKIQKVGNDPRLQITFKVFKIYKSDKKEIENSTEISIYSVPNIYGYEFEKGNVYLVFQNVEENGKWVVNGCTLTSKIKTKKQNNTYVFPSIKEVKDHYWGNRGKSELFINWLIKE